MSDGWLLVAADYGWLLVALPATFTAGWFLARRGMRAAAWQREAARADAGREMALKEQLQGQLAEERAARRDDERALRAQLREAEERLASERGDLAVAKAQLAERARHLDELQHAFERRQAEFRNEFKVLSKEILDKSQQDLSERNREGVSSLLSPLSVQLDAFRKRTDELHDAQTKERGAMREQLAQLGLQHDGLRQDAEALAQALRQDKKTLGNWGEMQVERLLEMSGLKKDREYRREPTYRDEEGRLKRPDFVIMLPEGRCLVIDSKVSLNDYIDCVRADDDATRQAALDAHVACVRTHIKTLSERGYAQLPDLRAPDFVFMFMPIEPAYFAAFEEDPGLLEYAHTRGISVVVPNTLLPTLRIVHSLWRTDKSNRSTMKLAEVASRVYDKLCVFSGHFERLGKQFDRTRDEYELARANLSTGRGNLIRTAEGFKTLGVKAGKSMSEAMVDDSLSDTVLVEALPESESDEAAEADEAADAAEADEATEAADAAEADEATEAADAADADEATEAIEEIEAAEFIPESRSSGRSSRASRGRKRLRMPSG